MKKSTHIGECQLCGHTQKLPAGRLSLHGYSVKWNCFVGRCPGSHGLPYETSCDLIGAACRSAEEQARLLRSLAAVDRIAEATVWLPFTRRDGFGKRSTTWKQCNVGDVTVMERSHGGFIEVADHENDNRPRFDAYGTHPVTYWNGRHADESDRQAQDLERYVAWCRQRIAAWKKQELAPVPPEEPSAFCAHREPSRWSARGQLVACRQRHEPESIYCKRHQIK